MAASVSTLWYVDAPDPAAVLREFEPDRDAAQALLARLFPRQHCTPTGRVPLTEAGACGGSGPEQIFVGSYPGVTVVSSRRLALRKPSELPVDWLRTPAADRTYLLVSDPPGAWGAFAAWECGTLRRAFGANTVDFFEDDGLPFVWERPFWAGDHAIRWPVGMPPPPQTLPFHPRKLVEEAHGAWLGFRYVGRRDDEADPGEIDVWGFTLDDHAGSSGSGDVPGAESVPELRPAASWWRRVTGR